MKFSYSAPSFPPKQLNNKKIYLVVGVRFMINKKIVLGMLIIVITFLLATNVLAAEPKFDKKDYKNSLKYAYKQINKNKLVKKGIVDKKLAKDTVRKFIVKKYKNGKKPTYKETRNFVRKELISQIRNGKKSKLTTKKTLNVISKKKFKKFNRFRYKDKNKLTNFKKYKSPKESKSSIKDSVVNVPVISNILGCTDSKADNYNSKATIDDNSCQYRGCTDKNANNFNSNANVEDGSCAYDVLGCMDNNALNYNAEANVDDNSCEYQKEEYFLHENILTTYFWVGEKASEDNSWIANDNSAWDSYWLEHFGGVDNPNCRNGYHPCGFTPKENPFYCALPYDEWTSAGTKKPNLNNILFDKWIKELPDQYYINLWGNNPYLKNRWIEIRFNGKTAYCQWEDTGPSHYNDYPYVFGEERPWRETHYPDHPTAFDVSPAVRDYLGLDGWDLTSWKFIDADNVPDGPWKEIVTHSSTCWGDYECKYTGDGPTTYS